MTRGAYLPFDVVEENLGNFAKLAGSVILGAFQPAVPFARKPRMISCNKLRRTCDYQRKTL
jgi:hypothetical protein